MAKITTSAGDDLFYREDCFAPPWEDPPATLLLHAEGETGDAWYGWVPRMAARARVIRPDMRGAGRSIGMRPGQAWSLDRFVSDVVALLDGIGVPAAHVVAARFAGPIGIRLAAQYPNRVRTLTLCSACPAPAEYYAEPAARWARSIEENGIDAWSVEAAQERLGRDAEEEMLEGWSDMLAGTDATTLAALFRNLPAFDASRDLEQIACPVLVAATGGSPVMPLEATTAWQRRIRTTDLIVMTGRGDHIAATHARDLAGAVQEFQRKVLKEADGSKREGRGKRRRDDDEDDDRPARGERQERKRDKQRDKQRGEGRGEGRERRR